MTSNALEAIWHEQLNRMIVEWTNQEQAWRQSLETPEGTVYATREGLQAVSIGEGSEQMKSSVTLHVEAHR